jgi:hypothetical protein
MQNVTVTPGSRFQFTVHVNGNLCGQDTRTGYDNCVAATTQLIFSRSETSHESVSTTIETVSSNMPIEIVLWASADQLLTMYL